MVAVLALASGAAGRPASRVIASSTVTGSNQNVTVSGSSNPGVLVVRVVTPVSRPVNVGWDEVCSRGSNRGRTSGTFLARGLATRRIPSSLTDASSCTVTAHTLARGGRLVVQIIG